MHRDTDKFLVAHKKNLRLRLKPLQTHYTHTHTQELLADTLPMVYVLYITLLTARSDMYLYIR